MSVLLGIFLFVFSPPISNPKIFHSQNYQCQCKILISIQWFGWFLKEYEFDVIFGRLLWRIFNSVIRILVKKHEKKEEISSNQIAYDSTNLFALRIVEFYHNFFLHKSLNVKNQIHWALIKLYFSRDKERKKNTYFPRLF